MHLLNPITDAVNDHSPDDGMIGIERISAAAVVGIARAVLFENVVGVVVEPTETKGRPVLVAFAV